MLCCVFALFGGVAAGAEAVAAGVACTAGADHARFEGFEEGFEVGDAGCYHGEGLDDLREEGGEVEGVGEAAVGRGGLVVGVVEVVDLEDCCCDCAWRVLVRGI